MSAFRCNGIGFSLLSLVLGLCTATVRAASFDCAKAQRPVEKVICGNAKLNAADEILGRQYRAVLVKLPPDVVSEMRGDQVQWLAWVQQVCKADDPGQPAVATAKCMVPVYDERIKLLRDAVVSRGSIQFVTRTQYVAAPESKADAAGAPEFPGFGTLQVSWPEAVSAGKDWAAWNRAIVVQAFLASGGSDLSKKTGPQTEPQWLPELAADQDTETTLQLKSVEHGRVTTAVNSDSMGHGAAHPNEAYSTYTWLLEPGRTLRADDVFAPNSGWQAKLSALCWAQIVKQGADTVYPEVKGPDAKPLRDVITDATNWTLMPDGLHISYPEYSISPRSMPMDDAVIPWAQLKPVLLTGFAIP